MGVRDVIAKPYNPELVLKRVDNLILLSEHAEGNEKNPIPRGGEAAPQRPLSNTALIAVSYTHLSSSMNSKPWEKT